MTATVPEQGILERNWLGTGKALCRYTFVPRGVEVEMQGHTFVKESWPTNSWPTNVCLVKL